MEFFNSGIWQAVVNGYTILTQVVDSRPLEKPFESQTIEDI